MSAVSPQVDPGLPGAVRALIGQPRYARAGDETVTAAAVHALCAAVRDANPLWWDDAVARELAGAAVAPVTMLSTWSRPGLWSPAPGAAPRALELHHDLKTLLGYPVAIVSAIEAEFHAPVRLGDRVYSEQRLCEVSAEKDTHLGRGRFWQIAVQYRNARGELLGVEHYECLGYRRAAAAAPRVHPAATTPAATQSVLEPLRCAIDHTLVVAGAFATRDYSPLHHDPVYAREQAGHRDVFLNTPTQMALIERFIGERLGSGGRIGRLRSRMSAPVYAGGTIVIEGSIVAVRVDGRGCEWAEVEMSIRTEQRVATRCVAQVALAGGDEPPWRRRAGEWQP